ncbi:C40 family peptidase [Winogradskyella echinorum]|uniref:C40 family peptidase n=1 Tax=Winogradskyella echinorum TaxID=538189 RepID=A0ABR6Y1F3_9FLAO|nr:C40 family peptidase [Winogradskyella echinorum]MBC3846562.1 C40 family peptidase [Winogradskyella echinorum]MBC5750910.1 C40 family peptidase [Winogradskyella echinorum]
MQYGLCNLGIVPIRLEPSDTSEMVTQALYGDLFKVLEQRKKWSRIRFAFDKYEGWIDNKQYIEIEEANYKSLSEAEMKLSYDLIEFVSDASNNLYPIPTGSDLNGLALLNHKFDGTIITTKNSKSEIVKTSFQFLNAPYLWGGKTPFGIDCSGFTQMVYKLNGYKLYRDASEQATQGDALSFIEESEPGDLAFFDNAEGNITHVGIIMEDNYIIHAHGKVRIDRLDHSGIYNVDKKLHTHKLRVIKKII